MPNENTYLWALPVIPILPLLAAAALAVFEPEDKRRASLAAIWAMIGSFLFSLLAVVHVASVGEGRIVHNFTWLHFGGSALELGCILDPLSAIMVAMITFVGTLIFIFSAGYMADDENYSKFFCYLSLFAAAMLGLIIANSLLLMFICWELVGLASYLLIGFWYYKPSAAAAAKKAFITTRIGDLGLFIGMLWLYSETGTLLFYDGGNGCLEQTALATLVGKTTIFGISLATMIALLIFCGAVGKSGQVPLHVWLPDAMEGPTPVSALIHAATMVAAGVFLMARIYPLAEIAPPGVEVSTTLQAMTWVGAITAVFASLIAIGQFDIKRVLAYSTVAQLGYMFMGLGVGGVAVGMFHLITHAFFKALLFLGSGSVIHGCHHEQDMRMMGGLKKHMPATFVTYAIGMMALSGFPLFFAGFWSKDEILHAAWNWAPSGWPFWMGLLGALLTAFYMTRQMFYVFYGEYRGHGGEAGKADYDHQPHESPLVMVVPLLILAPFAALLGFLGTPIDPWFQAFIDQVPVHGHMTWGTAGFWLLSTCVVATGVGLGWWLYGIEPPTRASDKDELEHYVPAQFGWLRDRFYIDEFYQATVIRWHAWFGELCLWFDRRVLTLLVSIVTLITLAFSWMSRFIDEYLVNPGFDRGCKEVRRGGGFFSGLQGGQVQEYLRAIGIALVVFILILFVGNR